LAAIMLLKQGDPNLAWVAADRGMLQAERSGNLLTIAGGARILAYAALDARPHATARDLCVRAATRLEPGLRTGPPEYLSAYGALLLKAAIASAKQGDRSATQELLDEAGAAGQRLGCDGNHLWTAFGPTNVAVHRVSAALELGDGGTAVEFAKAVRPPSSPSSNDAPTTCWTSPQAMACGASPPWRRARYLLPRSLHQKKSASNQVCALS